MEITGTPLRYLGPYGMLLAFHTQVTNKIVGVSAKAVPRKFLGGSVEPTICRQKWAWFP